MTLLQPLAALLQPHGFTHHPQETAFITMTRTHPDDDRHQILRFIPWDNAKIATQKGWAKRHLVILPTLNANQDHREDTRLYLPLVQWPSTTQTNRPWEHIAHDITHTILPLLDAQEPQGRTALHTLHTNLDTTGYIPTT